MNKYNIILGIAFDNENNRYWVKRRIFDVYGERVDIAIENATRRCYKHSTNIAHTWCIDHELIEENCEYD